MHRGLLIFHMLRELVARVLYSFLVFFRRSRSNSTYDSSIVMANQKDVLSGATLIGVAFVFAMMTLILSFKGLSNLNILLAALFLSFGLAQQIVSVCLDVVITHLRCFISRWNTVLYLLARRSPRLEWRFIEEETVQIFIYPYILHSPPEEMSAGNIGVINLLEYIRHNRFEVEYSATIGSEHASQLSFSQHALECIKEKLESHHQIFEIQQKTGAVNPIIFLTIGTIIWLLS